MKPDTILTLKEVVEAVKQVEELKKVNTILRNKRNDICRDSPVLSLLECEELGIERTGLISSVLASYKTLSK
jgi:hypothetical protein